MIGQLLSNDCPEAKDQLARFTTQQLSVLQNHILDNPSERSDNFSISTSKSSPTALLFDEVFVLEVDDSEFILVEPMIVEAIRDLESQRAAMYEENLQRFAAPA